jgi:hypothetical protein
MNAACLFSCRKELLRRVGEFSEIVPKPYTRARASLILSTFTRRGFDRDDSSVLDSIALCGPCRVNNDLGTTGGFSMYQRCARGEPICLLKGGD